jgi:hypothetical protein
MLTLAFRETRGRPELNGNYIGMYQSTASTYIEHTLEYGPRFLESGILHEYDSEGAKELESILKKTPYRTVNGEKVYGPYRKLSKEIKANILKLAYRKSDIKTLMSGLYFAQHLKDRCPDIKRLKRHSVYLHMYYGRTAKDKLVPNGSMINDAQTCFEYYLISDENAVSSYTNAPAATQNAPAATQNAPTATQTIASESLVREILRPAVGVKVPEVKKFGQEKPEDRAVKPKRTRRSQLKSSQYRRPSNEVPTNSFC